MSHEGGYDMNYEIVDLNEKIVVGFSAKTSNDDPDMNEIFQGCFALKNLKCSDETIRKEFEKIKHY